MPQLTFSKFPKKMIGNIVMDDVTDFAVGNTVTGGTSGATAKVIKIIGTTTLRVNTLTGIFVAGETVTNSGAGSSIVAVNGFDLSVTASGILRTFRTGVDRVRTEVLTAIRNMATKRSDAKSAPTFSAAVAYSGTAAMVTGDTLTLTITASEAVAVAANAYVAVTIGAATRHAVFVPALSSGTSLKFKYDINVSDVAVASGVVVGTTIVGAVADVVGEILVPATVTFVAPNTSTATVN